MFERLPENLFNLRRKTGKTQKEVAKDLGMTAAALSSYEKGIKEPSLSYAVKLARYYGASLDSMCGLESPTAHNPTASDLLQTITSLHDMVKDCTMKADADGEQSVVDISFRLQGLWLYDFIHNQNKITDLIKTAGLSPDVLDSWVQSKLMEHAATPVQACGQDAPPDNPDEDWAHKPYKLCTDGPKGFQI